MSALISAFGLQSTHSFPFPRSWVYFVALQAVNVKKMAIQMLKLFYIARIYITGYKTGYVLDEKKQVYYDICLILLL